jgi:hypothetical protein
VRDYSATAGLKFLLAMRRNVNPPSRAGKKPVGVATDCRVYWMLAIAQPLHPVGRLAVRSSEWVRAPNLCAVKKRFVTSAVSNGRVIQRDGSIQTGTEHGETNFAEC